MNGSIEPPALRPGSSAARLLYDLWSGGASDLGVDVTPERYGDIPVVLEHLHARAGMTVQVFAFSVPDVHAMLGPQLAPRVAVDSSSPFVRHGVVYPVHAELDHPPQAPLVRVAVTEAGEPKAHIQMRPPERPVPLDVILAGATANA